MCLTPGSTGHAMRHCLFDGLYSSTVWTAGIAADFDYRKNVVTRANYVWIYQSGASAQADAAGGRAQLPGGAQPAQDRTHYKVVDSYFAGNKKLAAPVRERESSSPTSIPRSWKCQGPEWSENLLCSSTTRPRATICIPSPDSDAAKVGAGLFTKSVTCSTTSLTHHQGEVFMTERTSVALCTGVLALTAVLLRRSGQRADGAAAPANMQTTLAGDVGNLSDKFTGLARVMAGKYDWRPIAACAQWPKCST